jgi:hypothetical protein
MRTLEEYLRRAEECEAVATTAASQEQRETIARMAHMWRALAAQRQKRLATQAKVDADTD